MREQGTAVSLTADLFAGRGREPAAFFFFARNYGRNTASSFQSPVSRSSGGSAASAVDSATSSSHQRSPSTGTSTGNEPSERCGGLRWHRPPHAIDNPTRMQRRCTRGTGS